MSGPSGGSSNTSTTTSGPPPQFLQAYQDTVNRATNVANQPLQQYSGQVVADLSPDQQAGISGVQNAQGVANPFINAAAQEIGASTNPLQPSIQPYVDQAHDLFWQAPQVAAAGGAYANKYFEGAPAAAAQGAANATNAFGNATSAAYAGQNNADNYFNLAGRQLTPTQFSSGEINKYESPYTQQVVNATQNEFNNQNAQQQAGVVGNAVSNNSFGGDRQAVAQALTAQQQQLAQAPVIAGLENQGYAQALQEFNQQQQTNLGAQQATQQLQQGAGQGVLAGSGQLANAFQGAGQGFLTGGGQLANAYQGAGQGILGTTGLQTNATHAAGQGVSGLGGQILGANQAQNWLASQAGFGYGNLGNEAQQTALGGANALLNTGGLEQQVAQENLNVPYQQFIQQQAYPFQTTSFLANIAEGLGGAAGGQSTSTSPGPSALSQGIGLGLAGAGAAGQLFGANGAFPDAFSSGSDLAGVAANSVDDTFFARGGTVPHRAPGGGLVPVSSLPPDLSISYIPGGGAPSAQHGQSFLNNPAMQNRTTTQGGGGGGGSSDAMQGIGDAVKIAGIAAMFLRDGGHVPERALGGASPGIAAFPMHKARLPGTMGINDNQSPRQMHPMRLAAGGTTHIDIPQLPGGIVPNAGPGGNGILIPQVGAHNPSAGISAVNDYLNASKAPPPAPHIIPNLAASIVPPPAMMPAGPPPVSFLGNGENPNPSTFGGGGGGNSEGGGNNAGGSSAADTAAAAAGGMDAGAAHDSGQTEMGAEGAGNGAGGGGGGGNDLGGLYRAGGSIGRASGGDTDSPGLIERLRRTFIGPDAPEHQDGPPDTPSAVPTMFPITADNSDQGRLPGVRPRSPQFFPEDAALFDPGPGTRANNTPPSPGAGISGPPDLQMPNIGTGSLPPPPRPTAPLPQEQHAAGPPPPPSPAPSPGITAPVTQGAGPAEPPMQHPGEPRHGSNWGETLLAMGLGMMGGTSPHAAVNIGRGGLQGLQYAEQQKLREEQQQTRMAQQADTAEFRRQSVDARRYGIDTRAGTAADSTSARLQIAQMLNDRVNFWKSRGFNELTANQKAMQDIRTQTLDLNTQKAAVTADQRQQGLEQSAGRLALARQSAVMRDQFKAQAATQADQHAADRATHAQMQAAVNLANGQGIKLPDALKQVMAGTDTLQPPRLPAAQTQQPAAPAGAVRVQSLDEARKLPAGTQFVDPFGVVRTATGQ